MVTHYRSAELCVYLPPSYSVPRAPPAVDMNRNRRMSAVDKCLPTTLTRVYVRILTCPFSADISKLNVIARISHALRVLVPYTLSP